MDTGDNTDVVKWSLIEVFTAVLCASLPSLRNFFHVTFKFFQSTIQSSNTNDTSEGSGKKASGQRSFQLGSLQSTNQKELNESTTELSPYPQRDTFDEETPKMGPSTYVPTGKYA